MKICWYFIDNRLLIIVSPKTMENTNIHYYYYYHYYYFMFVKKHDLGENQFLYYLGGIVYLYLSDLI